MHYTPIDMNEARSLLGGIDGDVPVTLTPGVQLPPTVSNRLSHFNTRRGSYGPSDPTGRQR
jgi:hypothetical protein